MAKTPRTVAIIGGGLAGLTSACLLSDAGVDVTLIEKKKYPFHKVCGEYVSNEVRPFLERRNLFPHHLNCAEIRSMEVTSASGEVKLVAPLQMGAFGVSRYAFDDFLKEQAIARDAKVIDGLSVESVKETNGRSLLHLSDHTELEADLTVGAYGKRSRLDSVLERDFIKSRSPYVGVKYHIRSKTHPPDLVSLHLFKDGYCGVCKIEADRYNLCYLTTRENLRKSGSIASMERAILCRNPVLKEIFESSDFLFAKPEVINEISFDVKEPVSKEIFMVGDAAGLITPLCGNGMSMAIHSAKILSEMILSGKNQEQLGISYTRVWNKTFSRRLQAGRIIQSLFKHRHLSIAALKLLRSSPWLTEKIVASTHGQVIE